MLKVELGMLHRHFIGCGERILVVVEGRDAAGKDGSIKQARLMNSRSELAGAPA